MNKYTIKRNAAKCLKCGDIIESKHRHDFVTCTCGNLSVDGGKDYLKRSCGTNGGYDDMSTVETIKVDQPDEIFKDVIQNEKEP